MANYYCSSADYTAVAQWTASHAYSVGAIVRQLATPAAGSERCFRCTTAGTSGSTEPTWVITRTGSTSGDGTCVWQEITGQAAYNGESSSTPWGAPFYSLLNATAPTFIAAGDTVYIRNTHSVGYSAATTIPFSPGTSAAVSKLLCTNATSMPPTASTLTTGASEYTNGAYNLVLGTGGVFWIIQGVSLVAGAGAVSANLALPGSGGAAQAQFFNCTLGLGGSVGGNITQNSSLVPPNRFFNCNFTFAYAGSSFGGSGLSMFWNGGAVIGTSLTSGFINTGLNHAYDVTIKNVDLSNVNSTIFNATSLQYGRAQFWNCKVASGVTLTNATNDSLQSPCVAFYNCDSGSTNYRYFFQTYSGNVQQSTSYTRTGGASDGTTPISWVITTDANANVGTPLVTEDIIEWSSLNSGTHYATVYLYTNAVLTNANCWLELDYPSSSSSPLGASVNTFAGQLVTGTGLTVDSSTWSGSALTYKYSITVSFNPLAAGPIRARLYLGLASATVYLDPTITVV